MSLDIAVGAIYPPRIIRGVTEMKEYPKILCGHTRSGKPVYQYMAGEQSVTEINPNNIGFDDQDDFDAYCIFLFLAAKEITESRPSLPANDLLQQQAFVHYFRIREKIAQLRLQADVHNAFELHECGEKLVIRGMRSNN